LEIVENHNVDYAEKLLADPTHLKSFFTYLLIEVFRAIATKLEEDNDIKATHKKLCKYMKDHKAAKSSALIVDDEENDVNNQEGGNDVDEEVEGTLGSLQHKASRGKRKKALAEANGKVFKGDSDSDTDVEAEVLGKKRPADEADETNEAEQSDPKRARTEQDDQ
jgi:hypothetical protein